MNAFIEAIAPKAVLTSGTRTCAGCGKTISGNKDSCFACSHKPTGCLEILNVGAGDVKIEFNKADVGEVIRAKRIIQDMLRRGYALIVEVERDGKVAYERVQDFDAEHNLYVIADLDASQAAEGDRQREAEHREAAGLNHPASGIDDGPPIKTKRGRPTKTVPMEKAKATAVGRSAGG